MGIGLGIVLVLAGLIFVSGVVNYDIQFIEDTTLGWIMLIVGVLAIVLALVLHSQHHHTSHVEERRIEH
jgi:uncharacterized membrane protein HdeD (DUF308 family)